MGNVDAAQADREVVARELSEPATPFGSAMRDFVLVRSGRAPASPGEALSDVAEKAWASKGGLARSGAFDEPFAADRSMPSMRHHFYWEDVPAEVIAADDDTNTHLPGATGPLSLVPFIASDHAGRVTCPVFIGLGERDSTPSHHDEAHAYRSSRDITFFVLPRSAHCHNSAGTRHVLWDRLAGWVGALATPERSGLRCLRAIQGGQGPAGDPADERRSTGDPGRLVADRTRSVSGHLRPTAP